MLEEEEARIKNIKRKIPVPILHVWNAAVSLLDVSKRLGFLSFEIIIISIIFSVLESPLGRLMANMFVSGSVRVQYVVAYLVFSVPVSLYIAS